MVRLEKAIEAAEALDVGPIDGSAARELREGWYLPYRFEEELMFGSNGIIVNKHTGACFILGSAFPIERDLKAYDEGFQFKSYDLTITSISDEARTLSMLRRLPITTVEPKVAHEVEWRIPRSLSRLELSEVITNLPYTFHALNLYFSVEVIQQARLEGFVIFELRESQDTDGGI